MSAPDGTMGDVFQPCGRLRLDLLDTKAAEAVQESLRLARETRWDSVRSPHVFMGLLSVQDDRVHKWGERLGADVPQMLGQFQELFQQDDAEEEALLLLNREFFSDNVLRLLRDAYQRAVDHGRSKITTMDLLITLLTAPNSIVAECFERVGLTAARLTELAVIAEQQAR